MQTIKKYITRLNTGYYTYLLAFLVILFAVRPYNQGFGYTLCWKFFITFTFLSAIFNVKHHYHVRLWASILALPSLAFGWLELFYPTELLFLLKSSFAIVFMSLCTISILYDVIRRARVTLEILRGVVCAYFMIAFVFAYIYYMIEYLIPGSFHLIARDENFVLFSRNFSEMMYFSFITLLTIGFGDITPLLDLSQTVVVVEGIIGQFYIAILVARIVSVYSISSDKRLVKQLEKDLSKGKSKQS
jgi:voltage-gated potassium channel